MKALRSMCTASRRCWCVPVLCGCALAITLNQRRRCRRENTLEAAARYLTAPFNNISWWINLAHVLFHVRIDTLRSDVLQAWTVKQNHYLYLAETWVITLHIQRNAAFNTYLPYLHIFMYVSNPNGQQEKSKAC